MLYSVQEGLAMLAAQEVKETQEIEVQHHCEAALGGEVEERKNLLPDLARNPFTVLLPAQLTHRHL